MPKGSKEEIAKQVARRVIIALFNERGAAQMVEARQSYRDLCAEGPTITKADWDNPPPRPTPTKMSLRVGIALVQMQAEHKLAQLIEKRNRAREAAKAKPPLIEVPA